MGIWNAVPPSGSDFSDFRPNSDHLPKFTPFLVWNSSKKSDFVRFLGPRVSWGFPSSLSLPVRLEMCPGFGSMWANTCAGFCSVWTVDHHLSIASIACLWIRSVRSGSPWSISCKCTYGDIRRRNPSSVDSVEDCMQPDRTSGFTTGYTQERNHLSVICVENGLKSSSSSGFTRQLILGREIFYAL